MDEVDIERLVLDKVDSFPYPVLAEFETDTDTDKLIVTVMTRYNDERYAFESVIADDAETDVEMFELQLERQFQNMAGALHDAGVPACWHEFDVRDMTTLVDGMGGDLDLTALEAISTVDRYGYALDLDSMPEIDVRHYDGSWFMKVTLRANGAIEAFEIDIRALNEVFEPESVLVDEIKRAEHNLLEKLQARNDG
jgi:hypothetical protein